MNNNIRLIDGKNIILNQYKELIVALLYQTGEELYNYQFISKSNIDSIVSKSWELSGSLFSGDRATVALDGDKLVGMEIGFAGTCFRKRQLAMKPIWDELNKHELNIISHRARQCRYLTPVISKDAYYVLCLSVSKHCQSRGIGKMLLNNAIKKASLLNLGRVQLDVISTYKAVRFYQHLGLQCLVESTSPQAKQNGVPTMFRMSLNT